MATIDKLDIGIYIQYARRTQYVEDINRQFHLEEARAIPPQTTVTDLMPKLSELDLLLGVTKTYAPWAFFYPPKLFTFTRKTPFTFAKVAPSIKQDEKEEGEEHEEGNEEQSSEEILEAIECKTPQQEEEKKVLKDCIKQIGTINEWLSFIVGRLGQLLQG